MPNSKANIEVYTILEKGTAPVNEDCLEWVQAGDAMVLIIYNDGSYKSLVEQKSHDYKALCLWRELTRDQSGSGKKTWSGSGVTETRAMVSLVRKKLADQIRSVRSQMNVTYGMILPVLPLVLTNGNLLNKALCLDATPQVGNFAFKR